MVSEAPIPPPPEPPPLVVFRPEDLGAFAERHPVFIGASRLAQASGRTLGHVLGWLLCLDGVVLVADRGRWIVGWDEALALPFRLRPPMDPAGADMAAVADDGDWPVSCDATPADHAEGLAVDARAAPGPNGPDDPVPDPLPVLPALVHYAGDGDYLIHPQLLCFDQQQDLVTVLTKLEQRPGATMVAFGGVFHLKLHPAEAARYIDLARQIERTIKGER